MKIVIDIPEDFYAVCKEWVADYCANIEQAIIAEGTPLLQGEWIFRSGVTCGGYYKCSNCGEVERAEKNYCPNCGARMKGGGANE